jgi:hypothetical protein
MPRKQSTRSTPSRTSKGGIRALELSLQFLTKNSRQSGQDAKVVGRTPWDHVEGRRRASERRSGGAERNQDLKQRAPYKPCKRPTWILHDGWQKDSGPWPSIGRERRGAADNVPIGCPVVRSTRSGLSRRMTMKTGRGNRSSRATTRSFGNGLKNGEPVQPLSRALKVRLGRECCVLIFRDTAERDWKRSPGKNGSSHSMNET